MRLGEGKRMLTIDLAKVYFIIAKAREFHAIVEPEEEESDSRPPEDKFREAVEELGEDTFYQELHVFLKDLPEDESIELLALMWLGRGDFTSGEWPAALALARDIANENEPNYLIGTPLIADYLEEGLSQLGYSYEQ
jgi:hypothetical protein